MSINLSTSACGCRHGRDPFSSEAVKSEPQLGLYKFGDHGGIEFAVAT